MGEDSGEGAGAARYANSEREGPVAGHGDYHTMSKFCSTLVLEHVRHMEDDSDMSVQVNCFEGCCMIVDVSGFTRMCEEFSKGEGRGSEVEGRGSDRGEGVSKAVAVACLPIEEEDERER